MFEDVDEVITTHVRRGRKRCGFSKWAQTLPEADRVRAEELVADRTYDCRALARYFQSKGASMNDQVLSRHRNNRCCQS